MRNKRASQDLSISIPSLFQCPISLDVMQSPVSLCTGITYDRSSIQKWLDDGHNTCPATMQILNSTEVVPNHTLHRLIQIWSTSVFKDPVLSKQQACQLISLRNLDVADLEKLLVFGDETDENRKFLVRVDGFLELVVDLFCNADKDLAEHALRIVPVIVSTEEVEVSRLKELMFKTRDDSVSSLLMYLRISSLETKVAALKVIEIIANDAESKLKLAEKEGMIDQLIISLVDQETDSSLIEAVLSCLITLSVVKPVKLKLISLGVIASIVKMLTSHKTSLSVLSIERMLKLLETVSSCKDGRAQICEDSMCVAAILNKTMKVSRVATEHAVTILWIVCYLFRGEKAIEAVAKNNGLTKILLVMQSNCSAGIRQMAGDVLKMLRLNSKSCLWCYDNKMTHITSIFD